MLSFFLLISNLSAFGVGVTEFGLYPIHLCVLHTQSFFVHGLQAFEEV